MHNSDISLNSAELAKQIPEGNRIIIDWISFSTRGHKPTDLIEILGLQDYTFEVLNGMHGYQYRHYFGGISIHFCENPAAQNGYIWLEMSGQGCRTFETYGTGDYEKLFRLSRDFPNDCRFKRIDVAFDDRTGVLDINHICNETRLEHYTSRLKTYESIYSNAGNSAYFGRKTSNVLIRFYDKAMERGFNDGDLHWIRCELQLRDVNSQGFVNKLEDTSLQDLYVNVLRNYVCFRVPDEFDTNKSRWEVASWWEEFLSGAVPQSVYEKPGVPYNVSVVTHYIRTQPLGSLRLIIELFGAQALIDLILNEPLPKNPKYKRLIAEYRADHQWTTNAEILARYLEERVEALELKRDIEDGYDEATEITRLKKVHEEERRRGQAASYLRSQGLKVKRW